MTMLTMKVIFALMVLGRCACQFPIPHRYDGFRYDEKHADEDELLLEAFIDPLCPDSRDVWPVVKELLNRYNSNVKFILHPFALPYHQNSFFTARALHAANVVNSSLTYPFLDLLFQHQERFSNAETATETPDSVVQRLTKLFAKNIGNNYLDAFKDAFHSPATDQAARTSFKYGCSRAVTGTPIFLLNGVIIHDVENWRIEDWSNLVDSLLNKENLKNNT